MAAQKPLLGLASILISASLALAGCATASAATAKGNQPAADQAAASEWASDARLMGIFGMEGTGFFADAFEDGFWGEGGRDEARNAFQRASSDDNVGDGRAEAWAFGYTAASKRDKAFVVFMDGDGKVTDTVEVPLEGEADDMQPIGPYALNSDDAADKAIKTNVGLRKGLSSSMHFLVLALVHTDEYANPVWNVAGGGGGFDGGQAEGGGGLVVLDAVTGAVLQSMDSGDWM